MNFSAHPHIFSVTWLQYHILMPCYKRTRYTIAHESVVSLANEWKLLSRTIAAPPPPLFIVCNHARYASGFITHFNSSCHFKEF